MCTNTPHWQQKSRYKEGVPCQSGNPQPLQVTVHCLQETLYPGQHSQASRHFEAIVTILTSGNICSEGGMHLYTLKQRCMVHTDMQVRPLTQYVAGDTAVSTYMVYMVCIIIYSTKKLSSVDKLVWKLRACERFLLSLLRF